MPKIVTEQVRQSMRQQIIRSAAEEFARIGFDQARMENIAERAAIGKGTVYLYFSSKETLFIEMLEEIAQRQLAKLKHSLENRLDLEAQLEVLVSTFNQLVREEPEAFQIFTSSLFGVNRRFKHEAASQRRQFLKLIEDLLKQAQTRGEIKLAVEPAALLVLNTCESLALRAEAMGFEAGYIEAQENLVVQMLLAGLSVVPTQV